MSADNDASVDQSRQKLAEIRSMIAANKEVIKPFFGVLFWECLDLEGQVNPEAIAAQGMQMTLSEDHDEILGTFLSHFIDLWRSSQDLNASSRFIAETLNMSASELLQMRVHYLAKPR